MCFRLFLCGLSLSLFIVTHASPSLGLGFTQDLFVFNAGVTGNTTVELSEIDPAKQSFQLTASGSIANYLRSDGSSFRSTPWIDLCFLSFDTGGPDITEVSVLGSVLPAGTSTSFRLDPYWARLFVSFPSPPLMDPFTWRATFELTTTGLLGSYTLWQSQAREWCWEYSPDEFDCDGGGLLSDDVFDFAIIPEPSAALVFALGVVIASRAGRRARRRSIR